MAEAAMGYLEVGGKRLYYRQTGTGSRLLLSFHGYGEDGQRFALLDQYLAEAYTHLAFDLPFHGNSHWQQGDYLHPTALATAIQELAAARKVRTFSLLGFSMGARVCLCIVSLLPTLTERLVLIASDGLAFDGYYHFLTRTLIGKQIFTDLVHRPGKYLKLIAWLRHMKMLDESRYKFVMHYLGAAASRARLLQIWPAMAQMRPRARAVKSTISRYNIEAHLVMGKYDRIMPVKLAQQFKYGLETVHLHILEKGHKVLAADTAAAIAQMLR